MGHQSIPTTQNRLLGFALRSRIQQPLVPAGVDVVGVFEVGAQLEFGSTCHNALVLLQVLIAGQRTHNVFQAWIEEGPASGLLEPLDDCVRSTS